MAGEVFIFGAAGGFSGGSSELTIVGGTTRPAKPTQNMIWVDTDVEITNYILSATEPEAPVEGMVWIVIGDSSRIKIPSPVGDNWITVYPVSVKQRIDSVWVGQTAKGYRDGEWVDCGCGYLFKAGVGALVDFKIKKQENAIVNIEEERLELTYTTARYTNLGIGAKYDLTGYHTLVCFCDVDINGGNAKLYISKDMQDGNGTLTNTIATCYMEAGDHTVTPLRIDFNVDGEYYVGVWGTLGAAIYNWYLE